MVVTVASPATAQERTGHHTLGSAGNVWRIELRNLERFLAMSAGDRDGTSELHWVSVTLSGPDAQTHKVTEVNPFLSINGGPRSRENTIDVRTGQRVFLERLEPGKTDTYNLWIHAKERPQGDLGDPLLNFEIAVTARELDCKGNRVCRRGSTGVITYHVSVPVPTVRHNRCNENNSYNIAAVNGSQMRLDPMSGGRARINVRSSNRGGDPTGSSRRLILAMQSGEICIASTSR